MSIVNPPLYDTPIFNPSNYSQTTTSWIEMMKPATQNGIAFYDNTKLNTVSDVVISSSNVGIGTTTPINKLDVVGNSSISGNFAIGTVTASSKLDISSSTSGSYFSIKKSFDTTDYGTLYSLPPVNMTSSSLNYLDNLITTSASTNSATAYYAFNTDDSQSWIGTDTGYELIFGSTCQYNGTSATTSSNIGILFGEYIQINCNIPFKLNAYRFKTANTANRLDPKLFVMLGSNDGNNYISLDQQTNSPALAANTFSQLFTVNSLQFYKYFRFLGYQLNKYGNGSFLTLNQLELKGVPKTLPITSITDSNCFLAPVSGNVGIGTASPTSKLDVNGDIIASFGNDNTRIVGISGFSAGKTGIFRFGDASNQLETSYGDTVKLKGYNGIQLYNNGTNEICRFGTAYNTLSSYFRGNVGIGTTTPSKQLTLSGGNVSEFCWESINANTDAKRWCFGTNLDISTGNSIYYAYTSNDANNGTNNWLEVRRSGLSVTDVKFPNGNMIVGSTATATAKLHVVQTTASDSFRIDDVANDTTPFIIDQNGNCGIGKSAPSYLLELGSDSAYKPGTSAWSTSSDERLKENISLADLEICYNTVKNIPLKRYTFKDYVVEESSIRDKSKLGWIAQDIEPVFPKAVTQSNRYNIEDCKSIDVDQLYASMYGTIQKLIQKVEALEALQTQI